MTATTAFEFSTTGYGEISKQGRFKVAQTGGKVGSVAGRAVAALEAGDWDGFVTLKNRSRKIRLSMTRHLFTGDLTEISVGLSYGHASLGAIRLPAGADVWEGMPVGQALELVGLSL